jgi:transposase InsO family protein
MSEIYSFARVSPQAHHRQSRLHSQAQLERHWVIDQVLQLRQIHPMMGLRKLYVLLQRQGRSPIPVGRDKFIAICTQANLGIKLPRSYTRTTYSLKSRRYLNLLADHPISDIDQLWVSDITYVRIGDRFEYLCMVMDLYSRRILGYDLASSLSAQGALNALNMALKTRKKASFEGRLIHHSDRGIQYLSNQYTQLLDKRQIRISLGNSVYENAHMERLNGIIKNEYIIPMNPASFTQLRAWLPQIMERYNALRPHWEIQAFTPLDWEAYLKDLPDMQRTKIQLFVEPTTIDLQQRFSNQLSLFSHNSF